MTAVATFRRRFLCFVDGGGESNDSDRCGRIFGCFMMPECDRRRRPRLADFDDIVRETQQRNGKNEKNFDHLTEFFSQQ